MEHTPSRCQRQQQASLPAGHHVWSRLPVPERLSPGLHGSLRPLLSGDAASGASFRCPAPSISQTYPMGASGFTGQLWRYSAASVPQCAERLG